MRILLAAGLAAFFAAGAAARADKPLDDGVWTQISVAGAPLTSTAAPADEYFGPQRLSNLGMRSMIHFMTLEGTSPLALAGQLTNIDGLTAGLAEWGDRYPRDPWLPDTMLKFAEFLETKAQPFTDTAAVGYLLLLRERYAGTPAEREAQKVLAGYRQTPSIDMSAAPLVWKKISAAGIPPRFRR